MKLVKSRWTDGYPLEEPSKSTFTPSRFLATIAEIALSMACWVAVGEWTIWLTVEAVESPFLFEGLITTTTRSPAVWAAVMTFARSWLFQPDQPWSVVLMVPSE